MARRRKSITGKNDKPENGDDEEPTVDDENDEICAPDEFEEDEVESENTSASGIEEEDVVATLFKGAYTRQDEIEKKKNGGGYNDYIEHEITNVSRLEPYTFDLRNLLAVNSDQLALDLLYNSKDKEESTNTDDVSFDLTRQSFLSINEEYLLSKATDGCAELIRALWKLPTEQSDAGPLAILPSYDEVRLPRAMPPPTPKQDTRWEKFAKSKGIPLNKEKRSRKVWDELTGSWKFRHGYEKANKRDNDWPIMEVAANDDPFEDPWEKQKVLKRKIVDKNLASRMKNEERAGNFPKGAANRVIKGRLKSFKFGKEVGQKNSPFPSGVPVDLKNCTNNINGNIMRGKISTKNALSAVQRSTASLGKFDKMREGEPDREKSLSTLKKRKVDNLADKKFLVSERQSSMKILNGVINVGGVAKAKAIRKGQLAKGETAYDYDFNDGLEASSFKKKKGRAGVGKMKKITKKRIK